MATPPKLLIVSSDCHAGALPATYRDYLPERFKDDADRWWLAFAREMAARTGTFFDQEAVEDYSDKAGDPGLSRMRMAGDSFSQASDDALLAMLTDEKSPFAPRKGEWDAATRLQELEADGVAGGGHLPADGALRRRAHAVPRRRSTRSRTWRASAPTTASWRTFATRNPGRHAGVALINVDDIDVSGEGGARRPGDGALGRRAAAHLTRVDHPFYHHPALRAAVERCARSSGMIDPLALGLVAGLRRRADAPPPCTSARWTCGPTGPFAALRLVRCLRAPPEPAASC